MVSRINQMGFTQAPAGAKGLPPRMEGVSDASFGNHHEKGALASQDGRFREETSGCARLFQTGISPRSEAHARCREAVLMA